MINKKIFFSLLITCITINLSADTQVLSGFSLDIKNITDSKYSSSDKEGILAKPESITVTGLVIPLKKDGYVKFDSKKKILVIVTLDKELTLSIKNQPVTLRAGSRLHFNNNYKNELNFQRGSLSKDQKIQIGEYNIFCKAKLSDNPTDSDIEFSYDGFVSSVKLASEQTFKIGGKDFTFASGYTMIFDKNTIMGGVLNKKTDINIGGIVFPVEGGKSYVAAIGFNTGGVINMVLIYKSIKYKTKDGLIALKEGKQVFLHPNGKIKEVYLGEDSSFVIKGKKEKALSGKRVEFDINGDAVKIK